MLSFNVKATLPPAFRDCHEEWESMMLTPGHSTDCVKHFLMKEYVTRKKTQAGSSAGVQEGRTCSTEGLTKSLLLSALFFFIKFK